MPEIHESDPPHDGKRYPSFLQQLSPQCLVVGFALLDTTTGEDAHAVQVLHNQHRIFTKHDRSNRRHQLGWRGLVREIAADIEFNTPAPLSGGRGHKPMPRKEFCEGRRRHDGPPGLCSQAYGCNVSPSYCRGARRAPEREGSPVMLSRSYSGSGSGCVIGTTRRLVTSLGCC